MIGGLAVGVYRWPVKTTSASSSRRRWRARNSTSCADSPAFPGVAGPGLGPRPELRKPHRKQPVTYRVTVDLNDAEPRIWRTLELRSDLCLDLVHSILQGAFGWSDSCLHMFAIGGGTFDRDSQLFLCPHDVEEGEQEGVPAASVRLDETLQEPGRRVRTDYVHDYGDNWDLTVRLDALVPDAVGGVLAKCVAGQRAAPPVELRGTAAGRGSRRPAGLERGARLNDRNVSHPSVIIPEKGESHVSHPGSVRAGRLSGTHERCGGGQTGRPAGGGHARRPDRGHRDRRTQMAGGTRPLRFSRYRRFEYRDALPAC
ncbi:MAG: plasmid pRiA4b ORF-3 family protein [Micrococcales bacterium]|nr:plasmid pRiA4b ORF-3 family protein [Micrococcales bacterium]